MLTRRAFGLAATSLLGGCATTAAQPPSPARSDRLVLAPVDVRRERVIRTVAGLRPFRPGGFVVRAEAFGAKRLTHNYGHGGGGVTLSWGSAHLAVEQGFVGSGVEHAVIGCGALGLATARLLQRRGAKVTIYAEKLPPETTSNIAGAQWWPSSVHDQDAVTPAYAAQFLRAAQLSYREFQLLVGPAYGVRWIRNYAVLDGEDHGQVPHGDPLADLAPEAHDLPAGSHPFAGKRLRRYDTLMIEPSVYLQTVLEDVLQAGGRLVVRRFASAQELAALPEPALFNCTGLGSRALFGDAELTPVKGQLVVLLPQPEVDYNLLAGASYMFPRADGIILGGSFERGNWDDTPDPAVTDRILARQTRLFATVAAAARG